MAETSSPESLYDLERVAVWVAKRGFRIVALQLPASLLRSASAIVSRLERASPEGTEYVVLSEGRCCPDEVAAMRFGAHCVVQLGRSCLAPARRLPVLHVLARSAPSLDAAHAAEAVAAALQPSADAPPVLVATDPDLMCAADELASQLTSRGCRDVAVARARVPKVSGETEPGMGPWAVPATHGGECALVYVGDDEASVSALRLSVPHARFVRYSPATRAAEEPSEPRARLVRRRLAVMRGAAAASSVALVLAASPSARNVRANARLREICAARGVRALEVAVGKVSEYKLANFCDGVEAFALASCPLSLEYLNSRDYPLPFVSAFELETALVDGDEWSGDYTTDYEAHLATRGVALADKGDPAPQNELLR